MLMRSEVPTKLLYLTCDHRFTNKTVLTITRFQSVIRFVRQVLRNLQKGILADLKVR